jgi:hypothetical protein
MPRTSSTPSNQSIHEKKIPTMPRVPTVPINSRPSFLQTMKEGISFGVGNSIGHQLVGMIFQKPSVTGDLRVSSPGAALKQEYEQCMTKYDDLAVCKRILEAKN